MSRMQGPTDKDGLHPHRWTKKSAGSYRHGKARVQLSMPAYLFDEIRREAESKNRSINSVTVEWLEAAYALSHEE